MNYEESAGTQQVKVPQQIMQHSIPAGTQQVAMLTQTMVATAGRTRFSWSDPITHAGKGSCCLPHEGTLVADAKLQVILMMGVRSKPPTTAPRKARPMSSSIAGTCGSGICCTASGKHVRNALSTHHPTHNNQLLMKLLRSHRATHELGSLRNWVGCLALRLLQANIANKHQGYTTGCTKAAFTNHHVPVHTSVHNEPLAIVASGQHLCLFILFCVPATMCIHECTMDHS